ncbi:MAG: endonuclease/exonuclease/phosphatase family protein [Bdellovibrionales bacterium]|nr:endonuclease/exonuclease/phosphatase family protein [Bdellovibrionales bacterium]
MECNPERPLLQPAVSPFHDSQPVMHFLPALDEDLLQPPMRPFVEPPPELPEQAGEQIHVLRENPPLADAEEEAAIAPAENPRDAREDSRSKRIDKTTSLKIATLNIRGSGGAEGTFTGLVDYLSTWKVDVCVLTETRNVDLDIRITAQDKSKWRLQTKADPTLTADARGVGLLCRDSLTIADKKTWSKWKIEELCFLSRRLLYFDVSNPDQSFRIVGAYGPTLGGDLGMEDVDGFFQLLAENVPQDKKVLVLGDLNAHIRLTEPTPERPTRVTRTSQSGRRLLTLMEAQELTNTTTMFRHRKGKSRFTWFGPGHRGQQRATLDYILCNNRVARYHLLHRQSIPNGISDHRCLTITLIGPQQKHCCRNNYRRHVRRERGRNRTNVDPRKRPNFTPASPSTSEEEWQKLKEYYIQRQGKRGGYYLTPYITAATHDLIQDRIAKMKIKRSTPNEHTIKAFQVARAKAKKALAHDKKEWIAQTAKKANDLFMKGDIHGAFQTLRPLYKAKVKPSSIPSFQRLQNEVQTLLQLPHPSREMEAREPRFDRTRYQNPPTDSTGLHAVYYTDGSAVLDGTKWTGGYGVCHVLEEGSRWDLESTGTLDGTKFIGFRGQVPDEATSDRAELYAAAIALLDAVQKEVRVVDVYTDSAYLITMTNHFEAILASGGDSVVNGDLLWYIAKVCTLTGKLVTFHKVRAHSGNAFNEQADKLASEGRVRGDEMDGRRMEAIFAEHRDQVRISVRDEAPTAEEIAAAAMKLSNLKAPGMDKITAETIKIGAKLFIAQKLDMDEQETKDYEIFLQLVSLIVRCWSDSRVPSEWTRTPITLIPKPGQQGKYRGIAVLSCLWKLISRIIAVRLRAIPLLHLQHGFRSRTGVLEAIATHKLYIQAARLRNEQLFAAYIDISRAYDSLDRPKLLQLIRSLGVGENIIGLLQHSFDAEQATVRLAGAFSRVFKTDRGVKQGDVISPLLFNIVMDAILRGFLQESEELIHSLTIGDQQTKLLPLFYADDGVFFAKDRVTLERQINLFAKFCAFYELEININKTNVCAFDYPVHSVNISAEANIRRYHASRFHQAPLDEMTCAFCNHTIVVAQLPDHWETPACKEFQVPFANRTHWSERALIEGNTLVYCQDNPEGPQVTHFRAAQRMQDGLMAALAPRDELGRALVHIDTDQKIPCPFGCATTGNRQQLCGHAISVHSDQILFVPVLKFLPNMAPRRCDICGWTTENETLHRRHQQAASCARREDQRQKALELEARAESRGEVRLNGHVLEYVKDFKYLGRIFTDKDSDMATFFRSLQSARFRWHQLGAFLRQNTLSNRCKRHLISVIIHSALLFGSESWVHDARKIALLRSFQQRILRSTFQVKGKFTNSNPPEYRYPSRRHVLTTAHMTDISSIFRKRRLAFFIRVLGRDPSYLYLKKIVTSFEIPGAETRQRCDGRRAWWTAQLRMDRMGAGVPERLVCVSHWETIVKNADDAIF